MTLVLITGNSGSGKSTVCEALRDRGETAIDSDWDGYNYWVDRTTGEVVMYPPYPVPADWLQKYGWQINRSMLESLAAQVTGATAYVCGSPENETEVLDLFDEVVCLIIDNDTLKERLLTRTNNAFGKHPDEMAAALQHNEEAEARYTRIGATVLDGTQPPTQIVDTILSVVNSRHHVAPKDSGIGFG